jgi:hypothetical protein
MISSHLPRSQTSKEGENRCKPTERGDDDQLAVGGGKVLLAKDEAGKILVGVVAFGRFVVCDQVVDAETSTHHASQLKEAIEKEYIDS